MKKIFLLLTAVVGMTLTQSCEGDAGPQGPQGEPGVSDGNTIGETFELKNVNFTLNSDNEYTIYRVLDPVIYDSDVILIYRLSGLINSTTPIWQLIPRTLYVPEGELDYDYDFSKQDFTIYAGGTFNLTTTPAYINNQTFRIVIVPSDFSKTVDTKNFNAVKSALKLTDADFKQIDLKQSR